MPKHIDDSNIFVPLTNTYISMSGATLVLPVVTTLSDVETRTIESSGIALSGEVKFMSGSGTLAIASGTTWYGVHLA